MNYPIHFLPFTNALRSLKVRLFVAGVVVALLVSLAFAPQGATVACGGATGTCECPGC